MKQSRLESMIETVANIVIGFSINWVANITVLPWFGFHVSGGAAFGIGLVFTAISVVRSYCLRRWFNARLGLFSERIARGLRRNGL